MVEYFEVDNHWVDKGTDIHDESVENVWARVLMCLVKIL